jgi:hypothetical protein
LAWSFLRNFFGLKANKAEQSQKEAAEIGCYIDCHVTRESVCAGDDVDADHPADFLCPVPRDCLDPRLACIEHIVAKEIYLPSVAGGSSWIAFEGGNAFAVIGKTDGVHVWPVSASDIFEENPWYFRFTFAYYLSNNPERLLKELAEGKMPERRYAENGAWPTG